MKKDQAETADEAGKLDDWKADWEGHRQWQLTAGLAATPAQRLAWLEEALEFAYRCGALDRLLRKSD